MKKIQNLFQSFSSFQKGVIFIFLSVFFALLGGVGVRYIVTHNEIDVFNLVFWGIAGGVFFSFPYIISSQQRRKNISLTIAQYPKALFFTIIVSLVSAAIWFYLLHSVSADTVSLFDQISIVWSIILGVLFFQERINILQIFALFLSAIGIYFVFQSETSVDLFRLLLLIGNPFLYALQSLIIKFYGKGADALSLSFLRGIGMCIPFFLLFFSFNLLSFIDIYLFLFLGLTQFSGMIVNKIFYIKAHEHLPISQLNFFFILLPIFTFFLSPYIEINYIFDWWKVFGAILVLLGVVLFLWKNK